MDTQTGKIEEWDKIPDEERPHFVRVMRHLSEKEEAERQIALYSPCGCGSGKKFKFCCRKKND